MSSEPTSPQPWYKSNGILAGISIAVIIIIAGTTFFLVGRKPSPATNTAQSDSSSSPKSDINRTPVSSTANAKTLAAQRLSQITGGASIDDLQKLQSSETGVPQANKSSTQSNQTTATNVTTPTTPVSTNPVGTPNGISNVYAQQLVQEKNITDNLVIYNETDSYYVPQPDQDPAYASLQGDEKNPIKTKTWYSANYYKSASYQGDKLISLYINTPSYSLSYYGGKYAIKDIYSSNNYFGGVVYSSPGIQNQELAFLKQILQNPDLKKLPTVQKDGKELDVYEETQSYVSYPSAEGVKGMDPSQSSFSNSSFSTAPENNYSTKYYVDKTNFVLYLTEGYLGGKLEYSMKTLKSQELKSPDLNKTFDAKPEIGQAPIKEFKSQEYYEKSSNLTNFSQKYGVLSVKQLGTKNISVGDNQIPEIMEYEKARNSPDFDPNFKFGILPLQDSQNYTPPIATVYQQKGNQSINFSFYTKAPSATSYSFDGYSNNSKAIKINLDGKKVDVKQYTNLGPEGQEYSATVVFQYGKYWLEVSVSDNSSYIGVYNSSSSSSKPASASLEKIITNYEYVTLNNSSIKEIEDYRAAKIKSTPAIEPTTLDQINASNRLLPGNLEPKYKVVLSSVVKSTKKSADSNCYNYLEYYYELESCLLEKFDGYGLGYTNYNAYTQNAPLNGYSSINFTILNTSISNINTSEIKTKLADDFGQLEIKPIDKGFEINAFGYSYGYILPFNDKTILLNYYLTSTDGTQDIQKSYEAVKELVSGLAIDKDINILKTQLEDPKKGL